MELFGLELIDGKSATGHVRSLYGSQRLYKCLQIAIKISEAFGSFTSDELIHGDIKSNNILVDGNGMPHLIDFELARALSSTGTGKIFWNTVCYAPPEQHDGLQELDTTVDVYAMAGVLHRMITNKPVFERVDNDKEAMHRRTTTPNISKKTADRSSNTPFGSAQTPRRDHQTDMRLPIDCENVCLFQKIPTQIPADIHSLHTSAIHSSKTNSSPDLHALHLLSLSGGDPALINRFAYSFAQDGQWVPDDYHEQVWHYLQHLPEATQRAFYVLACLGGKASTSLLHKFAGVSRRQLTKQLEKLPTGFVKRACCGICMLALHTQRAYI